MNDALDRGMKKLEDALVELRWAENVRGGCAVITILKKRIASGKPVTLDYLESLEAGWIKNVTGDEEQYDRQKDRTQMG